MKYSYASFVEAQAQNVKHKFAELGLIISTNILKNGPTRPLFRLFLVFSNKQYNCYNKSMQKMSNQYMAL